MTEIIDYTEQYRDDFKQLNLEWLEKYNLLEEHDVEVLDDPRKNVLDNGGHIYLAKEDNTIIGSAAIAKMHDGVYELAKMAVSPLHRGKGVSKILIEYCLGKARELKAEKIILFSNSQLKTAITLYEKY